MTLILSAQSIMPSKLADFKRKPRAEKPRVPDRARYRSPQAPLARVLYKLGGPAQLPNCMLILITDLLKTGAGLGCLPVHVVQITVGKRAS